MALIDPKGALAGVLLSLAASRGLGQPQADLTAVFTHLKGQVTLSAAGAERLRSVRPVVQRQVTRPGEIVHLPAGASVTLVCSTETLLHLTGPMDWKLDRAACGRGQRLPPSSYRDLTAFAGRILPKGGDLLLELETRNVDLGRGPVLLSPRNTAVGEPPPRLLWTRVPEAVQYQIVLRGQVDTSLQVEAADLQCGPGSGPWQGIDVCAWSPSEKWPTLESEGSLLLKLTSRKSRTAPWPLVFDESKIRRLSVEDQRRILQDLRRLEGLPMDRTDRLLLSAGAYARAGLNADAISAYDEVLQMREIPEARVTLGDLYVAIGLTAPADRAYRQVLAGNAEPAAKAAAEVGLGQVCYLRKQFPEARSHFDLAQTLYTALGLTVEAKAAQAAADSL